ncbi:alpha/beta fold hydrolase [Halalkalicoccus jeotgali]|uniref:Alpha/beta hydrolase fold protein n=1 Tax=Halalkalicoccus jeotgali (strain DSM 18796 / CECT 7217 / JCM 14584 / KCTC 4019 / B3) TaxID=795797 RepID=D8JA19_HALJB|nr:alpha/beta hydrolase [Halalkalicoccus jeotgali]ADJ14541.1 alpha/beta hydrolase fold protein [Halalkalicoccus jeotgali B3]ELY40113.1 alpha/beta hydrolase fold protein [Halalkalicoccus jeotgali B3]
MSAIDERYVNAGDYRLRYLQAGTEGPPVVLLHGGLIDAAHLSWGEVITPLAERFRVVVPDLLGYGDSDRPDLAYSTERHVAVIESFIDAIGIDSASFVGLSVGGSVALGLALRSPERVDRLVPVASYGLGRELPNGRLTYALSRLPALNRLSMAALRRSRRLTRASLGGIVTDPESLPPELVETVYELVQHPDAGRAYRSWRRHEVSSSGFRTDYRSRLGEIDAPTLFVHGREDEVFPPRWSVRAADLMGVECWVVPDAGHWVPRERPEEFAERVIAFLD